MGGVSNLVVVDDPHRHVRSVRRNVEKERFQTLLSWMTLIDMTVCPPPIGFAAVFQTLLSWMTLIDTALTRGAREGPGVFQTLLSWMTLIDQYARFGRAAGKVVSNLVVVDDPHRRRSTGSRRRAGRCFKPCCRG